MAGRKLITWGALTLLIWAAYEVSVRYAAMAGLLRMFFALAIGEGIPINRVVTYVDMSVFAMPIFLAVCVVFSILTIAMRNRPRAGYVFIPVAAILGAYGVDWTSLTLTDVIQWLRLIPAVMIIVGYIVSLIHFYARKTRVGKKEMAL